MEYTSKAVGNAGLTLGVIGSSLGVLNSAGGLAGLLGGNTNRSSESDPGDRPVTRYEMGLMQEITDKNIRIAQLETEKYTDVKADVMQAQLNQNAVWAATATSNMGFMSEQIQKLSGMTRTVIPDVNVVTLKTAAAAASTSSDASNG